MQKIPTMFVRDETKKWHPVTSEINPECQWVLNEEGIATIKLDGTNVKVQGGRPYKRQKPTDGEYDEASYVLCDQFAPADKWIWEAYDNWPYKPSDDVTIPPDGIYELIGPKIQGNPHGSTAHFLVSVVPPRPDLIVSVVRSFSWIKDTLGQSPNALMLLFGALPEGFVFHHPDGRMAKIKRRDFGFPWPPKV